MLGPLLFGYYINDFDENIGDVNSNFNTKRGGVVDSKEGCLRLQHDQDELGKLSKEW